MKILIVCGSTGTQGGAVFDAMENLKDWQLIGLSRNIEQPAAKRLTLKGITMREGDLEDLESLIRAFKDAHSVFGVTQPWNQSYTKCDTVAEFKQGRNIIDACRITGIKHLVLSTAAHLTNEKTGLPHVDIKIEIEEYARKSGVPTTYLKPAQFMDNVGMKFLPIKKGKIRGFIDGNAKVPYIAAKDIGQFARISFKHPKEYIGKEIKLIGDFVSGDELAGILGRMRGERFVYKAVPRWIIWLVSREFYLMRKAFEELAGSDIIDKIPPEIDSCRQINPDLLSMRAYLKHTGWDSVKI
ncbi:NmrA/HSCARG family protein [bacterium]|nr:NmrA/HSCARG family protein [bacterium]